MELKILEVEEQSRAEAISRLTEIRSEIASLLEQQDFELLRLHRTKVVSPINGFVHNSQVHTNNGVVAAGEILMTIIPSDKYIFRVRVRPEDIDDIYIGQSVGLRFSTLRNASTIELNGEVTLVSADQLVEPNSNSAYFRVEIVTENSELQKLGDQKLRPGLPVQAFIKTKKQTVLAYLLEPLTGQLVKTFRE